MAAAIDEVSEKITNNMDWVRTAFPCDLRTPGGHVRSLVLMFALSTIACGHVATERVTHRGASQPGESHREVDSGNLAAIRALLAEERKQFRPVSMPIGEMGSQSSSQSWLPDVSSPIPIFEERASVRLLDLPRPASRTKTEPHQHPPQVQRLQPTTRSAADEPTHHYWPAVAPYTFYAPTGSAYPGAIRCVPDFLGGQRCHNAP
jgi:hypothetical protein